MNFIQLPLGRGFNSKPIKMKSPFYGDANFILHMCQVNFRASINFYSASSKASLTHLIVFVTSVGVMFTLKNDSAYLKIKSYFL